MDFAELAPLAGEWNALLEESITHVPFLRFEYLQTWWATRGGGEWPKSSLVVITARQDGRLVGIAPMFADRNREGEAALLLLGSIEISDYLDLIVRPGDLPAFLTGLLDFLDRAGPADGRVLDWHNLLETSPTLPALKAEAEKRGAALTVEQTYHAPSIPLPGDFETYLAGIDKKQRHEIRRKVRRAEESGHRLHWYIVTNEQDLEAEIQAFLDLMREDPGKTAFLTDAMCEQMRRACLAAFTNGWLQLAFLEADGQKAAAYLNFDYRNRIWVYNSGFSRRFLDISVGWVLLSHLLQWANENKRSEFDFMRGNEDYKYRFGGVDKLVMRAKFIR